MYHEIERKFLIRKMPRLSGVTPVRNERYFLQSGDLVEERIQSNGNVFEYELKTAVSPREWSREKRNISESEFRNLASKSSKMLIRESYLLSEKSPRISVMRYKGTYLGLDLCEVEFDSMEEFDSFVPLNWMGTEITNSPFGRESKLITLDREHFLRLLTIEKDILENGISVGSL